MQQHRIRSAVLVLTLVSLGVCSCGQSGSDPIQQPEVRFEVRPAGQATFRVDSLIGNGVNHPSVSTGQTFSATAAFDFVLENAAPPFQGIFALVGVCSGTQTQCVANADCPSNSPCDFGGQQITVTLTVISGINQFPIMQVTDATSPGKTTATVEILVNGTPVPTPAPNPLEVRFDVCAPVTGQQTCQTTGVDGEVGAFGVTFTGTVGDPITSHILSGATPSIYFLEAPVQNVSAVYTRSLITGDFLAVQLFFNGVLAETQASTNNVIIQKDLP